MTRFTRSAALAALIVCAWPAVGAAASAKGAFLPYLVASSFVRALLDGRLDAAAPLCAPRVSFDGHWVEGDRPLREALGQLIARARRARLRLRTVQVLSHAEMIKRFGSPPDRLAKVVGKKDVFALARFQRMGLVIGLEQQGRLFRVKLLSD